MILVIVVASQRQTLETTWNILEPLHDWQSFGRAKLKTFMAHSGTEVSRETPAKHLAHAWSILDISAALFSRQKANDQPFVSFQVESPSVVETEK